MSENVITRRGFVQGTVASCAVLSLGAGLTTVALAEPSEGGASAGKQYGFWIDTIKCNGCGECASACSAANHFTEEEGSNRTVQELFNHFGDGRFISTSCMHCSVPSCEKVCPAGAIKKRDDGIVAVDHDRCIGCKYCYQACPFAIPRYTARGMVKCDCCLEAGVSAGSDPHCVQACPTKALRFGDVDELRKASGGRAQFIQASTGPNCLFS